MSFKNIKVNFLQTIEEIIWDKYDLIIESMNGRNWTYIGNGKEGGVNEITYKSYKELAEDNFGDIPLSDWDKLDATDNDPFGIIYKELKRIKSGIDNVYVVYL